MWNLEILPDEFDIFREYLPEYADSFFTEVAKYTNNNSYSCVTGIPSSRKVALVSCARKYMMKFVSGCSMVLMWFFVHLIAQFLRPRYCGVG
jgi:hypothetical protein